MDRHVCAAHYDVRNFGRALTTHAWRKISVKAIASFPRVTNLRLLNMFSGNQTNPGRLSKWGLKIYVVWAAVVFSLTFIKDGLSPDNVTHLLILACFGLQLLLRPLAAKHVSRLRARPKTVFITLCVFSAALVEICYMISKPLHPSLLITREMSAGQMLRNVGIDLAFTTPAYILIFFAVWGLINRYGYSLTEYVVLMSLGQAIGDGMGFFLLHPALLLFLPYVMINYQTMNVVPYLILRHNINNKPKVDSKLRIILPVVVIPVVYFISGSAIFALARWLQIF